MYFAIIPINIVVLSAFSLLVTRDHFKLRMFGGLITPGGLLLVMCTSLAMSVSLSLPCEILGCAMVGCLDFLEIERGPISNVIVIIVINLYQSHRIV